MSQNPYLTKKPAAFFGNRRNGVLLKLRPEAFCVRRVDVQPVTDSSLHYSSSLLLHYVFCVMVLPLAIDDDTSRTRVSISRLRLFAGYMLR